MNMLKSKFWFIIISLVGVIIAFLGEDILPSRFFNDVNTIINDPWNEVGFNGSYPLTILFYKLTYLNKFPISTIGLVQFATAALLLYKIGVPNDFNKIKLKNVVIYILLIVTAIYLSMPTKEYISFVFMSMLVIIFKKQKSMISSIILVLIGFLIFAYTFRDYYYFVIVTAALLFILNKIKLKSRLASNIFFGLLFAITLSLSHGAVKGEFISQTTREKLNNYRESIGDTEMNTAIVSPVDTSTWYGESYGIIFGFFSVNFPVNTLIKNLNSPQVILFIFWQIAFFILIFRKFLMASLISQKDKSSLVLFYVLIAFFITQGVFEPDLGSAIRHKAGIFPIIYFTLYNDQLGKKLF